MSTKEEAFTQISALIDRFREQLPSYKKSDYNETLTRRDFIDTFFKALGWDMNNSQGNAEAYREVIHEDRVKIGSATKAPDYSFRLPGGKRLFFVEAKKPSVAVKDDVLPAYQVRRYAWSAKLPVSILTDFEEFAVYDCKKKPNISDKASVSRIKYITYNNYLQEFDFIWDNFSKERVLKGGFDKYVLSDSNKKGTSTVDKEFLVSLDEWRKELAQNIALRNIQLNEDEINFTVQQTLDRLIFLRIAEDRGVEEYGRLQMALKGDEYYKNLFTYFKEADSKYNSGLFDFKKDTLSAKLALDNKVIKNILNELYYPISPYEFSVLSVEILGSAYEQFLGKQIRLTPTHKAVIEEKPEVRKAGGVYYTPQYIVEYIVQNTVGKLTEGKTPDEIAKLKIVDPACGSGSFLIGAYQFLLNYCQQYYKPKFDELSKIAASNEYNNRQRTDAQKERNHLPLTPDGNLTTAIKKQILLNNIFGVDIDAQAVEVTKLSLMLKCMEGETKSSLAAQMHFGERVLPTLDDNIKSGNSLIDVDFYDTELDFDEERKIKPFNWKRGFPEVFKKEGFDCVIGNPPWVDLKGHPADLIKYYFDKYSSTENRINLYSIFIEKSLGVLNSKGIFGFIIPNSLLYQSSYEKMRRLILKDWNVDSIVRLPDNVFYGVKAETIIITISMTSKTTHCLLYDRNDIINNVEIDTKKTKNLNCKDWAGNEFAAFDIFSNDQEKELLKKIEANKTELSQLCDFTLGITPYDKYKGHTIKQITERVFHSSTRENETFKPLLEGADIKRYSVEWGQKEYINYGDWLGAPRQHKFFTRPRILIRQIVSGKPLRIYAGYTEEELYNVQSVFNIIAKDNADINLKYLLAIINSNLMNFYHGHKYLDLSKNLFQKILIQNCKKFPIKIIDRKNKIKVQQETEIIKLVDKLLELNKEKSLTKLHNKNEQIQSHIDFCEQKINDIVYQLYELKVDEIKVLENP